MVGRYQQLPFGDASVEVVSSCAAGNDLGNTGGAEGNDGDQQHKSAWPEPNKVGDDIIVLCCLLVVTALPLACFHL